MDQPNHGQTPDLATILNNLAAIAQQQQQEQQQRQAGQATAPQQQYPSPIGLPLASYGTSTHASSSAAAYENSASTGSAPFHDDFSLASHNVPGYDNSTPPVAAFNISQDSQASARLSKPMNYPQVASGPRSTTPQKTPTPKPQAAQAGNPPMIDPATILEWSQGLRCITKIAAQNPGIRVVVQKMIADQHENELMWWGGRRARMNQRVSQEELKAYDAKIHRALREMFIAMSGHLKGLGVPFFGVRPELIVKDENAEEEKQLLLAKKKITESELVKLQRKMLEYLEAMYKD